MKNLTKIAATAAAVGALGVAGSFGTFAAMSGGDSDTYNIGAGTVDVEGTLDLGDVTKLGTLEAKKAGKVTFTNTGSEPATISVDQNGTPNTAAGTLLGENIEVDTYLSDNWTNQLDDRTRLQVINARPAMPLPTYASVVANPNDPTKWVPQVIQPGESTSLSFKVRLRQRSENGDNGNDNDLQGLQATQTIVATANEVAGP